MLWRESNPDRDGDASIFQLPLLMRLYDNWLVDFRETPSWLAFWATAADVCSNFASVGRSGATDGLLTPEALVVRDDLAEPEALELGQPPANKKPRVSAGF